MQTNTRMHAGTAADSQNVPFEANSPRRMSDSKTSPRPGQDSSRHGLPTSPAQGRAMRCVLHRAFTMRVSCLITQRGLSRRCAGAPRVGSSYGQSAARSVTSPWRHSTRSLVTRSLSQPSRPRCVCCATHAAEAGGWHVYNSHAPCPPTQAQ
ncbi:hypothetical protein CC85DRAFT_105498 [Cutaneotrichosporon oleaginosum]|uniref:Uncharacterized protein n=1 Tax=Cutaneotrichosporon oleaginosum TaxID=879819 RepID=A0A0J0XL91_9TREE|nr:uncharacterized protein CC85DRAFT_105498 [Cutaneotrichosporon oleaginosum]KLT41861.1 hypothetical protein CC85DRAFT_105498 [Cutaneotrichosporon oleaginosum]TXT14779.1 hypothetical protein COLE_00972 [Cutaneotrichosporon oleaginosum]